MSGYDIVIKAKNEAEGFYNAVIRCIDKGADPAKCKGFIKVACDKGVSFRDNQFRVGVPAPSPVAVGNS